MKNITILLLVFIVLTSCKEQPIRGVNVEVDTYLWVRNSNGQNLLDPATPGHYSRDSIKIFYDINGRKIEMFDPNLRDPRNFAVLKFEPNGEYYIRIFTNMEKTPDNVTLTYIQWNSADEDTIRVAYERSSSSVVVDKAWWNGIKKFDAAEQIDDQNWGTNAFYRFWEVLK